VTSYFSRAWGLREFYDAAGRLSLANNDAAHCSARDDDGSNRAGDYHQAGHWVAPFGMFALQPLFGDESYR